MCVCVLVKVSGLTCRSVDFESREKAPVSAELTEIANEDGEMEVKLI